MTNPITAEKVPVYVHSEKNMMPIGVVGTARDGYVSLADYTQLTAELASLQRERDAALHEISCCDDVNLAVPLAQSISELQQHRERAERERDGLAVILDLLRTGLRGEKYPCAESRSGVMVNVSSVLDTARSAGNGRGDV